MGSEIVDSKNITDHLVNMNIEKSQNSMFKKYEDFVCYNESDVLFSTIEFQSYFSSPMLHITITIAVVGALLNLIGVYILSSYKSMKDTFNRLLISLYCIDSLFLMLHIYLNVISIDDETYHPTNVVLSKWIRMAYSFLFKCSIFLTVGVSHERYSAMRSVQIGKGILGNRFQRYLVPVLAISVILSIPEYLETEMVWELRNSSSTKNSTGLVNGR